MKIACKIFLTLAAGALSVCHALAQQQTDASQNGKQDSQSTTTKPDGADKKAKKVWTDDDLHGLGGVSVVGDTKANAKGHSANGGKDATAANYKQQLAKLQAQLDDLNNKITELKNFNGDNNKDTGIQTNHRLSRGSVSDQIAQFEKKKAQITEQIQKIYDDARHNGIEPGALR
jgi:hypothetical protein